MTGIEKQFLQAEANLSAGAYEQALENYQGLPEAGLSTTQKIRKADATGYLFARLGERAKAQALYRDAVAWLTAEAPERTEDLGRMLNNLGRLHMAENPRDAVGCFDRSIQLYEDLAATCPDFAKHLANTCIARAEAYSAQEKYWFAKRDYKKAILLYTEFDPVLFRDPIAYAHYQLGNIYQEEFNAHDARNHYSRALKVYRAASEEAPGLYLPLLAATYNNLAQAYQALEDYDKAEETLVAALDIYRGLRESEGRYAPYLAATHTHLAVLRSEHRSDVEGALEQIQCAVEVYGILKSEKPEQFAHYWATSLHNTGTILAAAHRWGEAVRFFRKALEQRRELKKKQPGVFAADLCATALNLAECYINQIDSSGQWTCRDRALELLEEAGSLLGDLPDLPLTRSMETDQKDMAIRLRTLRKEDVLSQHALRQTRQWEDEIDGTLELDKKIHYQKKILDCWEAVGQRATATETSTGERVRALSNLAWLYLRKGMTRDARTCLEQALDLSPGFEPALCNRAHCDLLEGRGEAASTQYRSLWEKVQRDGKTFGEVINQDLLQLVQAGVLDSSLIPASCIPHSFPEDRPSHP